MKRIITFLTGLLTLAISYSTGAQQKATAKDQSLLWRISGKHMAKPSFLFGTIHLICIDDYVWTEKMKQSLANSEKICLEMNLNDPAVVMQATMGLLDTSGKKLEDYFTPEQFKLVKSYLKDSIGMDISLFEQMKPIALQSIIGTTGLNCDNPISYEDSIMKTALNDKKEIMGLEEPKEQIDVLGSISADTVVKQLMADIQSNNTNDSEYWRLVSAYKRQDLPALFSLITSSKELGDDLGVFLNDRNKKWIPRIADKMKQSSVFFAVGAGHLWGQEGVINLLRKDGYTVEPLK